MTKKFCLIITILLMSCSIGSPQPSIEQKLQSVLDKFILEHKAIPGVMVAIDSAQLNILWQSAAGVSDIETKRPITSDQPLRLASITKTYVAAAILRLMEVGKLKLDDPIKKYLPKHQVKMLSNAGYQPEIITIRHLLTHTSGIFDFAMNEAYFQAIQSNPNYRWSRDEQLKHAMDHGQPYGKPGEIYHYSDTGYILLGQIIEKTNQRGLATSLRELLKFDQLELKTTWLETLEPAPEKGVPMTSQYIGDLKINSWDPSFDLYGGGGLVANMPDVARFFRALFEGEIFEKPLTSSIMLTSVIPDRGGPVYSSDGYGVYQYCLGLYVLDYRGFSIFQHGGFWGTRAGYIPALGLSFSLAVTQQKSGLARKKLMEDLLDIVIGSGQQ